MDRLPTDGYQIISFKSGMPEPLSGVFDTYDEAYEEYLSLGGKGAPWLSVEPVPDLSIESEEEE